MKGEIISIETLEKMTRLEKELARARRSKNIIELELIALKKYYEKLLKEVEYLRKRDDTLTAIEKSLPQRIKVYKSKNAPLPVIKELEFWKNMLKEEKARLKDEAKEDK